VTKGGPENVAMAWVIEDAAGELALREEHGSGSPLSLALEHHPQPERALDLLDAGAVTAHAWVHYGDVHARLKPLIPGLALPDGDGVRVPLSLWRKPQG
jgi:hypothetical protein